MNLVFTREAPAFSRRVYCDVRHLAGPRRSRSVCSGYGHALSARETVTLCLLGRRSRSLSARETVTLSVWLADGHALSARETVTLSVWLADPYCS